jgi:hypothetical protein
MKRTNKLSVNKETVRTLTSQELGRVGGGAGVVVRESARCEVGGGAVQATTSSSIASIGIGGGGFAGGGG